VPPLREHAQDIPDLAAHFIGRFKNELDSKIESVSASAIDTLTRYGWPGNVRELKERHRARAYP